MSELLGALFKRRSEVDSSAHVFESRPIDSSADFCASLEFSKATPSAQEWLKSQPKSDEEDRVAELLAKGLEDRGPRPAHAPELVEEMRCQLEAERARMERQHLEREQALRAELEEMRENKDALRAELEELQKSRPQQTVAEEYPAPVWLDQPVGTANVGVVGESGVGKSLLINKLRGVSPGGEGWAPVGVNETTMEPTMYPFPNEPRVRFWDLPGAGTIAFPREKYVATMGLRHFDAVLVLTAGRFTETEVMLSRELEEHGVPFFMIRSKVDMDVWNNKEDNSVDEETTLKQIRTDLVQRGVAKPYLVSSRDRLKYDMMNLLRDIFPTLQQLPDLESVGDAFDAEAWTLPEAHSELVGGLQGCWRTNTSTFYVQGLDVHVTRADGSCAMSEIKEHSGKLWWCGNYFVDDRALKRALRFSELRWEHCTKPNMTILWYWAG